MKQGLRFSWLVGLGLVPIVACGAVTERHGADAGGAGGSNNATAGKAAVSGTADATDIPGTAGTIGNVDGVCRRDLDEFCSAPGRCPKSADDTQGSCSYAQSAVRMESSCGGTSVRVSAGLGVSVWHFDAAGQLIGAIVTGDTGNACFNGATTFYGELCELKGNEQSICPPKCDTKSVCDNSPGRFLDCPATYQSYSPKCTGRLEIVEYASSCGGLIIQASDGIQTEAWSFSGNGQVVGTSWAGDVGDSACWGKPCDKLGGPRTICELGAAGAASDEGSEGGAGNVAAGGAGGAP